MSKPTHPSVTKELCTCDYLQNAADDPHNPITFDVDTAEYQFSYDEAMLVIYHCPFCGGAAPESKRHLLFAQISDTEESRLANLLHGIVTIGDARQKLGKPDFEGTSTTKYPEKEDEAPRIQHHRNIRYHNLSDVAEIGFTERPDGTIFWQLQGKHVGTDAGNTTPDDTTNSDQPWWHFWRWSPGK